MAISVNLYLDTRTSKATSAKVIDLSLIEYQVKIAITKNSSTTYIPTGIRLRKAHWRNQKVVGRPDKISLNTYLQNSKARVMAIIEDSRGVCKYADMSVTQIKRDVSARLGTPQRKSSAPLFISIYETFAEKRPAERTKEIYRATAEKIKTLFPDANQLTIEEITLEWLEDFDERLILRGNKPSTRSIDFRNIRAVIKDAKKHKLIHENPFEEFDIPKGDSPYRALTFTQLRTLVTAEVKPWEQKYVDFFLLSFMLIGMNTEDLLHVKSIVDGRINYVRAKTHQEMSIKVEPEAMKIIERYKGENFLLNILDTYHNTHNWTSKVNNVLKEIAKRNKLPDISMYWARHTWAQIAHANLGIDISTISDALGHQPEKKVTLIYIKKKDHSKVDETNRKVLDYCLDKY